MIVLLLLTVLSAASGAEVCCPGLGCFNDNPPFDHLPLPQCLDVVQPNFNLFTRANRFTSVDVNRTYIPPQFSNSRQTMFLIHGWLSNRYTPWMNETKNALLEHGDYNVILVGWGGGAVNNWYPQPASNTRVAGAETAEVAQSLVNNGLPRANVYCVGHSLGAHTCGFGGKRYRFGRITGLDPAKSMFENSASGAHLWRTDADFVDILHTQTNGAGITKDIGHVDFYPNGGGPQPCALSSDDEVAPYPCSHARAHDFFTESINTDCFLSRHICADPQDIPRSCVECGEVCQSMGFHTPNYPGRGLFFLTTNAQSPYCHG